MAPSPNLLLSTSSAASIEFGYEAVWSVAAAARQIKVQNCVKPCTTPVKCVASGGI